jgi:hypothetical protein
MHEYAEIERLSRVLKMFEQFVPVAACRYTK